MGHEGSRFLIGFGYNVSMTAAHIRTANADDFPVILELNAAVVQWTAPLDLPRLQQLHRWAVRHWVITVNDSVVGFLLVMPDDVAYDSPNYRWFQQHHRQFWYVDRIVIDPSYAGQQLGSRLYDHLFSTAKAQPIERITCEYNRQPINQISARFHERFGFHEVATQWLDGGHKQVSLQVAELAQFEEHTA